MALTPLKAAVGGTDGRVTVPSSAITGWTVMVPAGSATTADSAGVLKNPGTLTRNLNTLVREQGIGTFFIPQLVYNDDIGTVTSPVIRVYGRYNSDDPWLPLANKSGDLTVTLTVAQITDVEFTSGAKTFGMTSVVGDDYQFDVLGCGEILVLVSTAFAASSGTPADGYIRGKII